MLKGSVQTAQLWINVMADLRLSSICHFKFPQALMSSLISQFQQCYELSREITKSGIGHIWVRECVMHALAIKPNIKFFTSPIRRKNKRKYYSAEILGDTFKVSSEYSDNTFIWHWMFGMFLKELIMSNHQIWLQRMPIGLKCSPPVYPNIQFVTPLLGSSWRHIESISSPMNIVVVKLL